MTTSNAITDLKQALVEAIANGDYAALESLVAELGSLNTLEAEAWSLIGSGVIEGIRNNNFIKSLECFELAKTKCTDLDDRRGLAKAVSNIGVIHLQTGNYISAVKHLQEGKDLFEETGDRLGVASTTLNSAMIHMTFKDRKKAMEELQLAYKIFKELDHKFAICRTLTTMGTVSYQEDDIEQALQYYKKSYAVAEQIDSNESKLDAGSNIVRCYIKKGILEKANHFFSQVDKIDGLAASSIMTKELVKGVLQIANGNHDLAHTSLLAALKVAQDANSVHREILVREEMLELAQKRKDFEGYVQHNEMLKKLKEETEGHEKQRLIAIQEKEREMELERKLHERERAVLYSALPKDVADRVVKGEQVTDHFDHASVLFLDIAGFTKLSGKIPAGHVVHLLEAIFSTCDSVCEQNNIIKVKTIGDSYMAAGGVSAKDNDHVYHIAKTAMEILEALNDLEIHMPEELGDKSWIRDVDEITVRIGLHCGPLVAGVVGKERLQYDVWGDTVNVASRMESTGEPGRIQVSEAFAAALGDAADWNLEARTINVKGKGEMQAYWLEAQPE